MAAAPQPSKLLFEGMHCEVSGSGQPVVLLHGFGESIFAWRHVIPRLVATHQVHAIDLLGHGRSEKPRRGPYAPSAHADRIARYVRHHQLDRPVLVGHSMGGGVALLAAAQLGAAAGRGPAGIVLLDSMFFTQSVPLFIAGLQIPVLGRMAMRLLPARAVARSMLRKVIFDATKIDDEMVAGYAAPLASPGARDALVDTAHQLLADDRSGLAEQVRSITAPTLILWGENDRVIPPRIGRDIQLHIAGSRLEVIPRCGHCPNEEQVERCLTFIGSFLDQLH